MVKFSAGRLILRSLMCSIERWHCRWSWITNTNHPYFYVLGIPSYFWNGEARAFKCTNA